MTFKHLTLTPASIAFMVSITVHAAIVVSVSKPTAPGAFANQIHSLQISLLPTSIAAQPEITQAKPRPRPRFVQQKSVEPVPVETLEETAVTENIETETTAENITDNIESPATQLQPPKFGADYLNNPPPVYPLAARRRNIEGHVLLRAEIQPDGSCSQVEIKQASPHELLNQAALEAVKKWRFVPASQDGRNVTAWVEIPIKFKLENQRS